MEYQNNEITQRHSQIEENNNQDVTPNPCSNYGLNQLYDKPQFNQSSNQNINKEFTQQDQCDQYFIMPQQPLSTFIKNNKIIIPFKRRILNLIFFLIIFAISLVSFIFVPSFHKIYYGIILTLNIILFLYVENNQIEIIKNEMQKKIYVVIKTFLFIPKKKYEFDIVNVYFKVGNI